MIGVDDVSGGFDTYKNKVFVSWRNKIGLFCVLARRHVLIWTIILGISYLYAKVNLV